MTQWDGASDLGGAPALLSGLPGDVEAERDIGPAVAVAAQASAEQPGRPARQRRHEAADRASRSRADGGEDR
jgi:hypothetical protein